MRWMIPLLAILGAASPTAAQSVFPLPIPTRPTSFPLTQRIEIDEDSDTSVVAWGSNAWGIYISGAVAVPAGLVDVVQVAAGSAHTLALKSNGTVVAWGRNDYGQTTVPAGLVDVVQVSAGNYHNVALKSDGTVVAWGWNDYGQTTVPAGLVDVVQVSAGNSHTVALKSDGTVVAWGWNDYGQTTVPAGLVDVVQIAVGSAHTLALKSNGTVVAWGLNYHGQTTVPAGLVDVVQVAAGYSHTLALKSDGTVVAWGVWGRNEYGQTTVPAGLVDVVQVAAGYSHTLALKSNGTVVAWGRNDYGQTTVPAGLVDVVQVSAGSYHNVALKSVGLKGAATKRPFDPATAANWGAGGARWTVDTAVNRDGVDSVKAQTTDGQSTYREYTVAGPAVVDFWWKVSSEELYDTFSYSVNGVNQQTISGEVDWTYRTLTLPAGTHTIRWTYTKDGSDAVGQDAGWLDDFAVYPATATLQVRDGATILSGPDVCAIVGRVCRTTVDFGSADVGSAGFTKSLTFANEGFVPLEVQLSLPEGSPFTFDGGVAVYDVLLARGETLDVPITLSTAVRGTKTAQLTISSPDSIATPPQIMLAGDVLGPVIGVTAGGSPVTSGQTIDLGLAPRTLQFTISNTGNIGNLDISQVSATGNFQITQQPQTSVAPQGSTTFTVLALGGTSGVQSGTVTINSNDTLSETFTINLGSKSLFSIGGGIAADSVVTSGTGGAVGWDFANTQLPSGQSGQALKTGATPNSGGSALEFTAQTAGVILWSWKVGSQENFDWLLCEVDGQEVAGISTKNGVWQTQVVNVPAGANVRWVYRKDASGNAGEDAGYLADVEFRSFAADQSFAQWGQTHGIYDPQQRLPKSGLKAIFAWLGGFDPAVGTSSLDLHRDILLQPDGMFLSLLLYRFSHSKTADGTQQILYSSDMSSWTTRRISQRIVSEDADRVVIEATAPSGTKGFFKVVGSGDTSMVWVEGGTLPQTSELAGTAVETFQIGKTEVTLAEWQEVRDWGSANGYDLAGVGQGSSPNHPVRQVSWLDAVKWANAKSEMEGLSPVYFVEGGVYRTGGVQPTIDTSADGYRLPTESEWEWAAQGGLRSQGYVYSGGNDLGSVAWNYANSDGAVGNEGAAWGSFGQGRGTWPVAQKLANELGIHDMIGNVVEWCADWVGSGRRLRGGSFLDGEAVGIRYTNHGAQQSQREPHIGFRLSRNAD